MREKTKRYLSMLLSLVLALSMCPMTGLAEEAMTPEGGNTPVAQGQGNNGDDMVPDGDLSPNDDLSEGQLGVEGLVAQGGEMSAQNLDSVKYLDDKGINQTCTQYTVIEGTSDEDLQLTAGTSSEAMRRGLIG